MMISLIFALAVLAVILKTGFALGELSLSVGLSIASLLLMVTVLTVVLNGPPVVLIVAVAALAIVAILAVFGGDLRVR